MSSQEYFTDPIKLDEEWHDNDLEKMDQLQLAAQYKPELAAQYKPDSEAEKALVRKIDKRIIPTVWALYTLSYLDRANVG